MTWLREVPPAHKCQMPQRYARQQNVGSVWQCDDCGRIWRFRGVKWGDEIWRRCWFFRQQQATLSDPPRPPLPPPLPKPGQGRAR